MASPGSSRNDRSWLRNTANALFVTIVSGVIVGLLVAWLIQDARFSPERRGTPTLIADQLLPTSHLTSSTTTALTPTSVTAPAGLLSTPISLGMSYNGTIASREVDRYSFVSSDGAVVAIIVSPVGPLLNRVEIHYAHGGKIAQAENRRDDWLIGNPYTVNRLEFAPEPGVEYVIHVRGQTWFSRGSYIIRMSTTN